MVQGRIDAAEAVWREFGFDGGGGLRWGGHHVRMSLGAFKHLLGCVRGPHLAPPNFRCCL